MRGTTGALFVIDGAAFEILDGVFDELERAVLPGVKIGRHWNALDDVLFGGMGTPAGGFKPIWKSGGYRDIDSQTKRSRGLPPMDTSTVAPKRHVSEGWLK